MLRDIIQIVDHLDLGIISVAITEVLFLQEKTPDISNSDQCLLCIQS